MKILFCTNVFEVVENGPVKFANLLLKINELYPEHELRILTEDVSTPRAYVHTVTLSARWKASPLSQFVRMWVYHQEAMRLRDEYAFDVLVYNNALVGLWSAYRFEQTVGMINDDNNLTASRLGFSFTGLKRWVFRLIEQQMALKAKKIIVNSDYLKKAVVAAYRISPTRVFRLYKAVEIPTQPHDQPPLDPNQAIRVLFIKNDFRRGGLLTLIEALSLLPNQFILTIVGPNPADKELIMRALVPITNIRGVFVGKVPQQQVAQLLQETHIFCVPSYKEALGVANLEAMAQGVPVVSTDVGGIPEVLNYGQCGWLVPPKNPQALADAIQVCISKPEERADKVKKAYAQVQQFDTHTMFSTFLEIISQ